MYVLGQNPAEAIAPLEPWFLPRHSGMPYIAPLQLDASGLFAWQKGVGYIVGDYWQADAGDKWARANADEMAGADYERQRDAQLAANGGYVLGSAAPFFRSVDWSELNLSNVPAEQRWLFDPERGGALKAWGSPTDPSVARPSIVYVPKLRAEGSFFQETLSALAGGPDAPIPGWGPGVFFAGAFGAIAGAAGGAVAAGGEVAAETAAITFVSDVPGFATNLATGAVTGGELGLGVVTFVQDVPGFATNLATGEVTGGPGLGLSLTDLPTPSNSGGQIRFVEDVPGYATDTVTGQVTGGGESVLNLNDIIEQSGNFTGGGERLPGGGLPGGGGLEGLIKGGLGLLPKVLGGLLPTTPPGDPGAPPIAASSLMPILLLAGLGLAAYAVVKK
jgi:hypothetical protein